MLGLSHPPAIELRAERAGRASRRRGPDARLLLRQRLHRGRGGAQDGVPVLAAAAAGRGARVRLPATTPTTATRSARCRSAASTCSTRCTGRCCSTRCAVRAGDADGARARRCAEHARRGGGGDRRAARAGRRGDAAPAAPATCARCAARATAHGVLLICDEVATGFGRTGTMFAVRAGGRRAGPPVPREGTHRRLPAARGDARHRARLQGVPRRLRRVRTFFHGHTFTGNPLACAVALATLDLFERGAHAGAPAAEDASLRPRCSPTGRASAHVAEVRRRGFMCGIELAARPAAWPGLRRGGPHGAPGDARGP